MLIINEVHPNDKCPNCGKSLVGQDIYETFISQGKTPKEALKCAKMYGWKRKAKKTFDRVVGVETSQYDGVTWWHCHDCTAFWKRFDWSDPEYLKEITINAAQEDDM